MQLNPQSNGGLRLQNPSGQVESPEDVLKAVTDERTTVDKVLRLCEYGFRQYASLFGFQALCQRFEDDHPWSDAELKTFSEADRIPQSFNVLRPRVWYMSGLQRMSRATIRVEGVGRGGDQQLADIGYKMLKYNAYVNNLTETDSLIYRDGLRGKGDWHTYFDPFRGEDGQVVVERVEPGGVIYDPNCMDLQLKGCGWQARLIYMKPQAIKARWKGLDYIFDSREYDTWWDALQEPYRTLINQPNAMMIDRVNNLYAVIEVVEASRKRYYKIVNQAGADVIDPMTQKGMEWTLPLNLANDWMMQHPGYLIKAGEKKSMVTTHVLPYKMTQLGVPVEEEYEFYPYTPYLSGYSGQKLWQVSSYVNGLVSPQREVNLRRSNQIEYLQRDLRGGGYVPEDTDLTKELNKVGTKVNTWHNIKSPSHVPIKTNAAMPSEGMRYLEESGMQYLDLVSGINMMSSNRQDFAGESGVHRKERRDDSNIVIFSINEIFDNQRGLVAKVVLERMVAHTTSPRVMQIIGEDGQPVKPSIDPKTGQPLIDPTTGQMVKPVVVELTQELISRLRSISEWDIRVQNGQYQTEMQKDRFDRKMQQFVAIVGNYPPGVVMPGDFIRGGDFGPEEEELADKMDSRFAQLMAAPPSAAAPTPGGGNTPPQSAGGSQ